MNEKSAKAKTNHMQRSTDASARSLSSCDVPRRSHHMSPSGASPVHGKSA